MVAAAEAAVPPPLAANPDAPPIYVNCVLLGAETTGNVPLYPATATPATVTDCPAERPCAALVVMVTRKPFSVAPVGDATIATAAGCVAPVGLATTATITFSSTTVGPAPGPPWLTRSKFVSSY